MIRVVYDGNNFAKIKSYLGKYVREVETVPNIPNGKLRMFDTTTQNSANKMSECQNSSCRHCIREILQ